MTSLARHTLALTLLTLGCGSQQTPAEPEPPPGVAPSGVVCGGLRAKATGFGILGLEAGPGGVWFTTDGPMGDLQLAPDDGGAIVPMLVRPGFVTELRRKDDLFVFVAPAPLKEFRAVEARAGAKPYTIRKEEGINTFQVGGEALYYSALSPAPTLAISLRRVPLTGGDTTTVGSLLESRAFAADARSVYFLGTEGTLWSQSSDGGEPKALATGFDPSVGWASVALDEANVYVGTTAGVVAVSRASGAPRPLSTRTAFEIAVDGPNLYLVIPDPSKKTVTLERVPKAGGCAQTILTGAHPARTSGRMIVVKDGIVWARLRTSETTPTNLYRLVADRCVTTCR